jgi:hypothetical protein
MAQRQMHTFRTANGPDDHRPDSPRRVTIEEMRDALRLSFDMLTHIEKGNSYSYREWFTNMRKIQDALL